MAFLSAESYEEAIEDKVSPEGFDDIMSRSFRRPPTQKYLRLSGEVPGMASKMEFRE